MRGTLPSTGAQLHARTHIWLLVAAVLAAVPVANGLRTGLQLHSLQALPQAQQLNCQRVHAACAKCANSRIVQTAPDGTKRLRTVVVCNACMPGWRLRKKDLTTPCECAPGLFNQDLQCVPCLKGNYCLGGGLGLLSSCPDGLATYILGAKSKQQCMSTPGVGRISVRDNSTGMMTILGMVCPLGSYNIGGNTGGCQLCPIGLTTTSIGAKSVDACVAVPGSYISSGVGKLCPKGTFTADYNKATFCTACGNALTTAGEGSNTSSACNLAIRGYYFNAADQTAVPCPLATYQETENPEGFCKPCPRGLQTKATGSAGVELCTAPPGWELKPFSVNMSQCARGSYKETWAMEACLPCGDGLDTASEGSFNRYNCFIPPGWGLASVFGRSVSARLCVEGTYGRLEPTHDLNSAAACTTCRTGLTTTDLLTNTTAEQGYMSEEDCLTLPGVGFDPGTVFVKPCPLGFWSAGGHRSQCTSCPSAFTTLKEGSRSDADCVMQPGWTVDTADNLARPCDAGTYGTGGTPDQPNGACLPCRMGRWTQRAEAASEDECDVCAPGWGSNNLGQTCELCPYNTYSYGGSAAACTPCPAGHTSERGTATPQSCVEMWPLLDSNVYIHASSDDFWAPTTAGAGSFDACKGLCGAGCIMFRYRATPGQCHLLMELQPGDAAYSQRAAIGLKAFTEGVVHDYAFHYVARELILGNLIADLGSGSSITSCMKACTARSDCIVVRVIGSSSNALLDSCQLYSYDLDSEFVSVYRVDGSRLFHDGYVTAVSTDALSRAGGTVAAQSMRGQG